MTEALFRHWHTLRAIPRFPRKISSSQVAEKLRDRGFTVTMRSVQRDLQKLSQQFPLVVDERSVPYGWYWAAGSEVFDVPGIDLHTALAFGLAAEHLEHLLPHTTYSYLTPHFARAQQVLETMADSGPGQWADRVRVIPAGVPMASPRVDRDILEAIHDGIARSQQIKMTYCRRGETKIREYTVHPHGLVYKDSLAYLVCSLWHYDDIKQLAIHRIQSADLLAEGLRTPPGFTLAAYIASGEFAFKLGANDIKLEVLFAAKVVIGVLETPLSPDQTHEVQPDGQMKVTATVHDTVQLRVWLRGFGDKCEVVAPASLRAEFKESALAAAAKYT